MLYLNIPKLEGYDNSKQEFVTVKPAVTLQLEHSLLSMSKWEAKWKKPFLSPEPKTMPEVIYYIKCMTINKNIDKSVYSRLTKNHINAVMDYMGDRHSAYKIRDQNNKKKRLSIPTTEEYYYSMFYYGIPIECEKWHFSNLVSLLDIANKKNAPVKKRTAKELNAFYSELNAARCAEYGTTG